jgi:hypothetical protein
LKRPERSLDAATIRLLDVADLVLALRPDRTPEECIARLEDLIERKSVNRRAKLTLDRRPILTPL